MRKCRTIRLGDEERDRLREAAQREGIPWTTWTRRAALREAERRLKGLDEPDTNEEMDDD